MAVWGLVAGGGLNHGMWADFEEKLLLLKLVLSFHFFHLLAYANRPVRTEE